MLSFSLSFSDGNLKRGRASCNNHLRNAGFRSKKVTYNATEYLEDVKNVTKKRSFKQCMR